MTAPRRQTLSDRWLWTSRVALLTLTLMCAATTLAGGAVPILWQAVAYLIGMVLLNLPHGGVEHYLNLRHRSVRFSASYVLAFLALIGAFLLLLQQSPAIGFTLMLLVAIAKAGGGDLSLMDAATGSRHLAAPAQRALAVMSRGGMVMILPIVCHPSTFQPLTAMIVSRFGTSDASRVVGWLSVVTPYLLGVLAMLILLHLAWGYRTSRQSPEQSADWRRDLGDTALLATYFALVPPLVSVGLYFPFWYSARQIARALRVEDTSRIAPDSSLALHRRLAPEQAAQLGWLLLLGSTLAVCAVALVVWLSIPNAGVGAWALDGVVYWTLFISIIAFPHIVIGAWLDREHGIWYVPRSGDGTRRSGPTR